MLLLASKCWLLWLDALRINCLTARRHLQQLTYLVAPPPHHEAPPGVQPALNEILDDIKTPSNATPRKIVHFYCPAHTAPSLEIPQNDTSDHFNKLACLFVRPFSSLF